MDVQTVENKIKSELTWLQKHERLILAAMAGVILWLSIGKIDTLIINHDASNLAQTKVVAAEQAEKNKELATQVAEQAAQYKALAQQVEQQNAALEQANVQLAQALTKQQKTDAMLPPNALAQRWNTLVPTATATVTPSGIAVPQSGAVATVQELEKVPVLSSQLENERTQLGNTQNLLDASRTQVSTLTDQVSGLRLQAVDDAKVCKAQVAEVKAQARKSKRTWFTIGYVAGLATRGAIRILAGF